MISEFRTTGRLISFLIPYRDRVSKIISEYKFRSISREKLLVISFEIIDYESTMVAHVV